MTTLPRLLLLAACLATPIGGAFAQGSDSNIQFDSALLRKKKVETLPDVKPQPQAWPRLDPGAVLCRTEDDLDRLSARRHGEQVSGPIDCQVIRDPTAISIQQRKGPGRTEVTISDPKAAGTSGWTDVWLPAKAPASSSTASK
jgi:hypothetical protein